MEIVGVDISEKRISVCKNMIKKYVIDTAKETKTAMPLIKIFHADGTTFRVENNGELVFDSRSELEEIGAKGDLQRKKMNKSARARERRRLYELSSEPIGDFDYVLVDAECSTDGAVR